MKRIIFRKGLLIFASLLLFTLPAVVSAQTDGAKSRQPPIAQQLVREGNLAINLTAALGLGTHDNEVEAESILGDAGIVPRNGWVADYPVTPDIIGELEKSVGAAADARKITLSKDEALKKLRDVNADMKLSVSPYSVDQSAEISQAEAATYPDEAVLDDYYESEGPPVVTYYAPPPDYFYLYSWVPSPFWCADFWFPGFFILNDFHRPFFFGGGVFFVSNHFRDFRSNGVFRIDPRGRFNGRTFAGIGITDRRGFLSTSARSGEHAFNGSRPFDRPAFRNEGQVFSRGDRIGRTTAAFRTSSPGFSNGGRMTALHSTGGRMNSSFAHSGMRSMGSPSFGGGRFSGASFSGARGGGGGFGGSFGGGRGGGGRR